MTARFIHTADWQLGKPFAGVEDVEKRSLLRQERFEVLKRIGTAAKEHDAKFIVVAGDLFDSPNATKDTVAAACAAIGAMDIPVYVIPGNHDHGGPGSLWEQSFFQGEREQLAQNLTILLQAGPVEVDCAVLLPCPLLRRHEASDTTSWLRSVGDDLSRFEEKPRIVIAHGSIQGFGSQEDDEGTGAAGINRVDLTQLTDHELDYLALGDWHGSKQVGPKSWYSGTPELDRFPKGEGNEPGYVLAVTAGRGVAPQVERVPTSRLGWHQHVQEFSEDAGVELLEEKINSLIGTRAREDLLRLELSGSLGIEATSRLEGKLEAWNARLLRLNLTNRTMVAPSDAEVDALARRAADPLVSAVAAKLIPMASSGDEEASVARTALRELHAACSES